MAKKKKTITAETTNNVDDTVVVTEIPVVDTNISGVIVAEKLINEKPIIIEEFKDDIDMLDIDDKLKGYIRKLVENISVNNLGAVKNYIDLINNYKTAYIPDLSIVLKFDNTNINESLLYAINNIIFIKNRSNLKIKYYIKNYDKNKDIDNANTLINFVLKDISKASKEDILACIRISYKNNLLTYAQEFEKLVR